jgi:DegV family protein with EDD domain
MHLKNGGRIPAAIAYVGTVLNIKPILTIKDDGKLESFSSVRGKKKAFKYLAAKVAENIGDSRVIILLGHANIKEDADTLVDELRSLGVENRIIETCLSATIASHVGPGMLAVAFMGNKDRISKK